ncbi:MAG: sigma-54-dependent transcriptional regulator [Planctomycetota bacterium]
MEKLPVVPVPYDPALEGEQAVEPPLVLVVDEDREEGRKVSQTLSALGLEVDLITNPALALEHLVEREYELVLTELHMREVSGFEVLALARRQDHDCQVVIVTGKGSPGDAVRAMHEGALTYLSKPLDLRELEAVVRRALERVRLARHAYDLERRLESRFGFESIIGSSEPMQKVFERLRQVAPTDASVLILGENGTGKELVAKALHQNSPRRHFPFVALNCAALSDSILESELFGHEKGAFTGATAQRKGRFEYANKGTLFLDEVGDMPMPTQIKLLRVLEEREIVRVGSNIPIKLDVRLIAATNADLEQKVAEGTFRQDLYYRLKVFAVVLPPLRDRASDIPLLAEKFLRDFSLEYRKPIDSLTPEARRMLASYSWPGNVRELRSAVQHMVVVATTPVLDVQDLPDDIRGGDHEPRSLDGLAGLSLEDVERELIRKTLQLTDGNREQAAKILKIGERTLYRKLNKFNLR